MIYQKSIKSYLTRKKEKETNIKLLEVTGYVRDGDVNNPPSNDPTWTKLSN